MEPSSLNKAESRYLIGTLWETLKIFTFGQNYLSKIFKINMFKWTLLWCWQRQSEMWQIRYWKRYVERSSNQLISVKINTLFPFILENLWMEIGIFWLSLKMCNYFRMILHLHIYSFFAIRNKKMINKAKPLAKSSIILWNYMCYCLFKIFF